MLMIPPIEFRKRHKRKARPTTTAPLPPLVVTEIVNVMQTALGIEVNLKVDTTEANPLADVSGADPAKWTARYDGVHWTGVSIEAVAYDELFIVLDQGAAAAGSPVIAYAANPSDIGDTLGRMLGACEVGL